jgi:hypothetical protein
MLAEWSAECALQNPVLVVPWNDPDGGAQFIDLRADPYDVYLIPEAERYPPLLQALRALNASRSPVFTAKCDVWPLDGEELDTMRLELDLDSQMAGAGLGSYVDLVWRDRAIFVSRHMQEQTLDRIVRRAAEIDSPLATLECVLRPAVLDWGEAQEGYAISAYIRAVGADSLHAQDGWGRAFGEVVRILRGPELARR